MTIPKDANQRRPLRVGHIATMQIDLISDSLFRVYVFFGVRTSEKCTVVPDDCGRIGSWLGRCRVLSTEASKMGDALLRTLY